MIRRLRAYLPAHDESGRYQGPLSTYQEYHALWIGLRDGLTNWRPKHRHYPDIEDVQAEKATYSFGYVAGTLIHVAIILGVGSQVL